jgi:large subunit ribosomal protein L13
MAKKGEIAPKWHEIDASGKVLGRLAVKIATLLMGKHRPTYTPHQLTGDCVIVTNCEKVKLTGRKLETKEYDRYTFYPSGRHITPVAEMLAKHPERVIQLAVKRMLPRNKLGRQMLERLKIYRGPSHKHQAQRPEPMAV